MRTPDREMLESIMCKSVCASECVYAELCRAGRNSQGAGVNAGRPPGDPGLKLDTSFSRSLPLLAPFRASFII